MQHAEHEGRKIALLSFWLLYVCFTAVMTWYHEPWRDEIYPWLIGRELGFLDIYREASYSGAPALWYYIVAIPAKLGLPAQSMQLIHWLMACAAMALFLRHCPLPAALKIIALFGHYFAYEHAIIARNLMPTILLIFITCTLDPQRMRKPWPYMLAIVLMANTSFFGMLAGLFFALRCLHDFPPRAYKKQYAFLCAGFLLAAGSFIPPADALGYYRELAPQYIPQRIDELFGFAFAAPLSELILGRTGLTLRGYAFLFGIAIYALTLALLLRRRAFALAAFTIASLAVMVYVVVFKYPWAAPRHYSFLMVYTLMVLWLLPAHKTAMGEKCLHALLYISFLLAIPATAIHVWQDMSLPFSGTKAIAKTIRQSGWEDAIFVAQDSELAVPILAYLPDTSLWDPEKQAFIRFSHSDKSSRRNLSLTDIHALAATHLPKDKPIYLIANTPITDDAQAKFRPMVYAIGQRESFWICEMIR